MGRKIVCIPPNSANVNMQAAAQLGVGCARRRRQVYRSTESKFRGLGLNLATPSRAHAGRGWSSTRTAVILKGSGRGAKKSARIFCAKNTPFEFQHRQASACMEKKNPLLFVARGRKVDNATLTPPPIFPLPTPSRGSSTRRAKGGPTDREKSSGTSETRDTRHASQDKMGSLDL